jgi:hypothetical protein
LACDKYYYRVKLIEFLIDWFFFRSFLFDELRVDEALRLYLETFRLPGEAPVISYLLEHFAEHWHVSLLSLQSPILHEWLMASAGFEDYIPS